MSACLQAVCRLYQLSKNDASPPSEKKPFYIIPDLFAYLHMSEQAAPSVFTYRAFSISPSRCISE